MSVNLVKTETAGESVPPSIVTKPCRLKPCANSTSVLIGRNGRGQWIARERHGLYGGLFVSREKAVSYALFENGHRAEAIIIVAGILELDMSTAPTPDAPLASRVMPQQDRAA